MFHIFFFSSRRRHTRWPRDWSSDVYSSDLEAEHYTRCMEAARERPQAAFDEANAWRIGGGGHPAEHCADVALIGLGRYEIGRASCRERVEIVGLGVALKKKEGRHVDI